MTLSAFDNLTRLVSQVSTREEASTAVREENRQRARRYDQIHREAMGAFARFDIMLNKLHAHGGGRYGR